MRKGLEVPEADLPRILCVDDEPNVLEYEWRFPGEDDSIVRFELQPQEYGTLLVLDASLPGGLIEGSGSMRYAQTMAFTTLMLFQIFNVLNARSDERSAFVELFTNKWLWAAMAASVVLQVVVYAGAQVPAGLLLDHILALTTGLRIGEVLETLDPLVTWNAALLHVGLEGLKPAKMQRAAGGRTGDAPRARHRARDAFEEQSRCEGLHPEGAVSGSAQG